MSAMHIAQLNIGRLIAPQSDPRVAEFMNNLDRINGLAERMPGFVWRYMDDSGSATDSPMDGDPQFIFNLTVWESAAALENFVFGTIHNRFYERRAEWFQAMDEQHFVMWPVAEGHRPTIDEARERLAHLNQHGDSALAFGWTWMALEARRCAAAE